MLVRVYLGIVTVVTLNGPLGSLATTVLFLFFVTLLAWTGVLFSSSELSDENSTSSSTPVTRFWLSFSTGLVTNSILFCMTFHNQGSVSKSAFSTNAQSRFASVVVDGVVGPPRLTQHTCRCPCISVVPEATH